MTIDSYSFGQMVIDGEVHTSDVIVLPNRVIKGWWRREGHKLWPEDLDDAIGDASRSLIVGTGSSGLMVVTGETLELLERRGTLLVVEPTSSAWETYNRLSGPGVVGVFHLTC